MKQYRVFVSLVLIAFTAAWVGNAWEKPSQARGTIQELTSRQYWGRGYTNDGMNRAAHYLVRQLRGMKIAPIPGQGYFQTFEMPVNTFPGQFDLKLNGKKLEPGKDFIVTPGSKGVFARGTLIRKDDTHFQNEAGDILITLKDKLTWSVSKKVLGTTEILLDRARFAEIPENFDIRIINEFKEKFQASNVIGMIPGTVPSDEYLVLSAHYDHLGGMGKKTFFPGANDNASGVAMLLEIARHYQRNRPKMNVVFMFFAAEEAGLVGSKYFVEHPTLSLEKIRFLLNLDLVGTGDDGATVVNSTVFPEQFSLLQRLNSELGALSKINPRGKAANSDHYWFSEKGVPAFFLYTMGGIQAYHDVFDVAQTLPMTRFNEVFQLIIQFENELMRN